MRRFYHGFVENEWFLIALLYPWAVQFRSLGFAGFVEMSIFVLVLSIGLLYAWLRGALEWD